MSDGNTNLDRTMWCPKKCDLLVLNTISDPYEFKWSSKEVIFLLIAMLSGYIALNEPLFIFDNLPYKYLFFIFLLSQCQVSQFHCVFRKAQLTNMFVLHAKVFFLILIDLSILGMKDYKKKC